MSWSVMAIKASAAAFNIMSVVRAASLLVSALICPRMTRWGCTLG